MERSQNIMICPMNWGLGHAGRMIPLATSLRKMNHSIFVGAGQEALALFRCELPGIELIHFDGFIPSYSRFLPQYLSLLFQSPRLVYHSILEHHTLKKLIREYNIDIVISDNRFGLWNRNVKTVYVTHMPRIPFPKPFRFLEFTGVWLHRMIIKKYSYCFIPDLPGNENLSGRLSHNLGLPLNTRYIGILSRFTSAVADTSWKKPEKDYAVVILSGPEPQRSILKEKLLSFITCLDMPAIILGGRPDKNEERVLPGDAVYYNHLTAPVMKQVITNSGRIVTRPGYTTIMELVSLGCSALLIPTPGQTEQEYLGEHLSRNGWFDIVSQKHLEKEDLDFQGRSISSDLIMKESMLLLEKGLKELSDEK